MIKSNLFVKSSAYRIILIKLFILFLVLFSFKSISKDALATVSSCSVSVSPESVVRGSNNNYTFTLENTDEVSYDWIKIRRPGESENWTIIDGSAEGWVVEDLNENDITLTGNLDEAENLTITVNATAADEVTDSMNWVFEVSDDTGNDRFSCDGSFTSEIADYPEDPSPEMSDITISEITSSTVKLSWTTNENTTAMVEYGTTDSYDLSESVLTPATSHSVNITDLTANTNYHFNIINTDSSDNTVESGDQEFQTAAEGLTSETKTVTVTNTVTVTPTPTPTQPPDTASPVITISTDFSDYFKASPRVLGKITDNIQVSEVEYSIDDGKNWINIEKGITGATYSLDFVPVTFGDGNYFLKVRAKDSAGNVGLSKTSTIIIDRLVPQVGGSFMSIGPLGLVPDSNGVYFLLKGLEERITVSTVGGPTSINLLTAKKSIKLKKNITNGLWQGNFFFDRTGTFQISADSVDGAKNQTIRDIATVKVLELGKVVLSGRGIEGAEMSVYYLNKKQNKFVLWQGEYYNQSNPQLTNKNGEYKLYLPAGTYYIQVINPGSKIYKSEIFTLENSSPINSIIRLEESGYFDFLNIKIPLPDFSMTSGKLSLDLTSDDKKTNEGVLGSVFPDVELVNNTTTSSILRGKKRIVTFINTWFPYTSDQIRILESVTGENEFEPIIIVPQETASQVNGFKKRGDYKVNIFSDQDGRLVLPLKLNAFPAHFILDEKSIVKAVKTGILNRDEILELLK